MEVNIKGNKDSKQQLLLGMGTEFEKTVRRATITISVLIITILQLDFFITKEFMLESILNLGLTLVLLIHIFRKISIKIYSKKFLAYIINGLIVIAGLYCFSFLLLLYWGYGFSGKKTPLIWTSAFFLNLLLILSVIFELRFQKRK